MATVGHKLPVELQVCLDPPNPVDFTMQFTTPKGRQDAGIDIATFRIERLGGLTEADHAYRSDPYRYRSDPYRLVGAIAVADGHVEATMKRLQKRLHLML